MSSITLTHEGYAEEESSCGVKFYFYDTDEVTPITPLTPLTWTLTNNAGTVINTQEGITITPGESVIVILSGDDLKLPEQAISDRVVTIEGTYNSNTLGTSVIFRTQHTFPLVPLDYS